MEDQILTTMKETPSTYHEGKKETYISAILKLYAGLEKIKRRECNKDLLENIKKAFQRFFVKKEKGCISKNKLKHLFDVKVLEGCIKDQHRETSCLIQTEDSKINGDTLLLRAMSILVEKDSNEEKILNEIIYLLVKRCPEMIVQPKNSTDYDGITPLHLAINNENENLVKDMVDTLKSKSIKDKKRLKKGYEKNICAKGPAFQDNVMMAGTPLGVAALKFNKNIFNIVLRKFDTDLDVMNSNRDNIIHSLIKYAHIQPEKLNSVLEMISYVLDCKFIKVIELEDDTCTHDNEENENRKWKLREKARKLLTMTNKDHMNPLQLAGKRQQFQIFYLIMQNEVYHNMYSRDGFFNEEIYDITEIETLKLKMTEISSRTHEDDIRPEHHESILEYIVHHEPKTAFLFADFLPIKEIVKEKWKYYRWFFLSWFVVHLVIMVVLSVAAVYRSKVKAPVSRNTKIEFSYVVTHDTFVSVVSVVGLVFGLIYLMMEISRVLISRFLYRTSSNFLKRVLRNINSPYSNQIFRTYFTLFSLLLVLDYVVAATEASGYFSGYENYCLIFVVIIGWYLTFFFLQTFKAFSIFSVLIQRAIADMLKFALVMTFLLIAFSVAMYMIMQGVETDEDGFDFFSTSLFKMLTIMLGIGELGILFQARQPYLAIFVFLLFVLLTTILLLNALIAIMSNSCTDLMSNYGGEVAAKLHCRLQKLSVILFLEGCFPNFLCKEVGLKTKKYRFHTNKLRRIWIRTSVHKHNRAMDTAKATHILNNTSPNEGVVWMMMQNLYPYLESLRLPDSKVAPVNTTTHAKNNVEINAIEDEDSDTVL